MKKASILLLAILGVFLLSACNKDEDIENVLNGIDYTDTSEELSSSEITKLVTLSLEEFNEGGINLDKEYESFDSDQIILFSGTEITASGVYLLSGDYESITIDCEGDVTLLLDNATIASTDGPSVLILNADDVTFSSLPNTENTISDTSYYSNIEYSGAIYSKSDLIFNGSGILHVYGNYNDAIVSKDDIKIVETTINITSVDDGIVGKDYIAIKDATININADGDGLKSTNEEDELKGYIYIESGTFTFDVGGDGIDVINAILIQDGDFTINSSDSGLDSGNTIVIGNGVFDITAVEDGINTTTSLIIYNGEFLIDALDDGFHSDIDLTIEGGQITIEKSYEGIEAFNIYLNGGTISVTSTDDGINGTSGGGQEHGTMYQSSGGYLEINGGIIVVNSSGDGIDVNGTILMTGGYVTSFGTTESNQGALDYDISCTITGGVLITVGSTGMIQTPSDTSTQNSLIYTSTTSISGGKEISLLDSEGNMIFTLDSIKTFAGVVISSPSLVNGETFTLVVDDEELEFTVSDTLTTLGAGITGMEPGMPGGIMPPRR